MIKLFNETIKNKLPDLISVSDFPIHFLKFSTAGSGNGVYNKVIFLAFKNKGKEPFLVVKTVRKYADKETIINGFKNLSNLNKAVYGSEYEEMFPKALYLYNDGKEIVFSIESACGGVRVGNDKDTLALIIKNYFDFQKHLSKKHNGVISDIHQYLISLINNFGLSDKDRTVLLNYFQEIYVEEERGNILAIPQHGDLTGDNVFIDGNKLCVVDCDLFGIINLAGFDLFHLLIRYDRKNFKRYYKKYFEEYFYIINNNISAKPHLIFIYYIQELATKQVNLIETGVKEIIRDFEKLL